MTGRSTDNRIIGVSTELHRPLLCLYPPQFHAEYGPKMTQVFRDCCLRSFHQAGAVGMVTLWVLTLFDLARSAIEQHLYRETGMSHSHFIRLGSWALMLAAVPMLLVSALGYLDLGNLLPSSMRSLFTFGYFAFILGSPVLLAVGLLGLRSRYGGSVGGFGKQALLVGVVAGLLVSLIGIVGEAVSSWDRAWFAQFAGPGVLSACLAIFGISVLSSRPLPRWNALPLLAGLGYPLIILYALMVFGLIGDERRGGSMAVYTLIMTVQCIALFMLGYVLQSDARQGQPVFA
jgi:hypothetical protein